MDIEIDNWKHLVGIDKFKSGLLAIGDNEPPTRRGYATNALSNECECSSPGWTGYHNTVAPIVRSALHPIERLGNKFGLFFRHLDRNELLKLSDHMGLGDDTAWVSWLEPRLCKLRVSNPIRCATNSTDRFVSWNDLLEALEHHPKHVRLREHLEQVCVEVIIRVCWYHGDKLISESITTHLLEGVKMAVELSENITKMSAEAYYGSGEHIVSKYELFNHIPLPQEDGVVDVKTKW